MASGPPLHPSWWALWCEGPQPGCWLHGAPLRAVVLAWHEHVLPQPRHLRLPTSESQRHQRPQCPTHWNVCPLEFECMQNAAD